MKKMAAICVSVMAVLGLAGCGDEAVSSNTEVVPSVEESTAETRADCTA